MPPPALVIFDCDGVLVDSERIAVRMDAEAFGELGWALTPDDILERFVGRSHAYVMSELEAHLGRPVPDGWEQAFDRRYREALAKELRAVDGVEEALDAIAAPSCVASSGSHDKMRFTLGLTGLWERFEGRIFSATEVVHGKPAPDLFLHAAARMGVAPEACAVIEDSRFGVQAARAAGMRAFGYAGGLTPAAWLEGDATMVFTDMRELPGLLGQ